VEGGGARGKMEGKDEEGWMKKWKDKVRENGGVGEDGVGGGCRRGKIK
jgi:hypothetical protein